MKFFEFSREIFLEFFSGIVREDFFGRNFLRGILGRIFWGGFFWGGLFWEDFWGGFFWEDFLGGILCEELLSRN